MDFNLKWTSQEEGLNEYEAWTNSEEEYVHGLWGPHSPPYYCIGPLYGMTYYSLFSEVDK